MSDAQAESEGTARSESARGTTEKRRRRRHIDDQPQRRSQRPRKDKRNDDEIEIRPHGNSYIFTNVEKQAMLDTLFRCDTIDIDKLCKAVPSKSKAQIMKYIQRRECVAQRLKPVSVENDPEPAKETSASEKWLRLLTANTNVESDRSYLLGNVLAICSKLEPHFIPLHARIPRYELIYSYFHSMLRCEPLPKMLPTEASLVLHVMDDLLPELKSYDTEKQMDFLKTKFKQLQENVVGQVSQVCSETTNLRKRPTSDEENHPSLTNKKRRLAQSGENGATASCSNAPSSTATSLSAAKEQSSTPDGDSRNTIAQPSTSTDFGASDQPSSSGGSRETPQSATGAPSSSTGAPSSSTGEPSSTTDPTRNTSRPPSNQMPTIVQSLNPLGIPISLLNMRKKDELLSTQGETEKSAPLKESSKVNKAVPSNKRNISNGMPNLVPRQTTATIPEVNTVKNTKEMVEGNLTLNSDDSNKQSSVQGGNLTLNSDDSNKQSSVQGGNAITKIKPPPKKVKQEILTMIIGQVAPKGPRGRKTCAPSKGDGPHKLEMVLMGQDAKIIFSALIMDSSNEEQKKKILGDIREIISTFKNKQEAKVFVKVQNNSGKLLTEQKNYLDLIVKTARVRVIDLVIVEALLIEECGMDGSSMDESKIAPVKNRDFVNAVGRPFGHRQKHWSNHHRKQLSPRKCVRTSEETASSGKEPSPVAGTSNAQQNPKSPTRQLTPSQGVQESSRGIQPSPQNNRRNPEKMVSTASQKLPSTVAGTSNAQQNPKLPTRQLTPSQGVQESSRGIQPSPQNNRRNSEKMVSTASQKLPSTVAGTSSAQGTLRTPPQPVVQSRRTSAKTLPKTSQQIIQPTTVIRIPPQRNYQRAPANGNEGLEMLADMALSRDRPTSGGNKTENAVRLSHEGSCTILDLRTKEATNHSSTASAGIADKTVVQVVQVTGQETLGKQSAHVVKDNRAILTLSPAVVGKLLQKQGSPAVSNVAVSDKKITQVMTLKKSDFGEPLGKQSAILGRVIVVNSKNNADATDKTAQGARLTQKSVESSGAVSEALKQLHHPVSRPDGPAEKSSESTKSSQMAAKSASAGTTANRQNVKQKISTPPKSAKVSEAPVKQYDNHVSNSELSTASMETKRTKVVPSQQSSVTNTKAVAGDSEKIPMARRKVTKKSA